MELQIQIYTTKKTNQPFGLKQSKNINQNKQAVKRTNLLKNLCAVKLLTEHVNMQYNCPHLHIDGNSYNTGD